MTAGSSARSSVVVAVPARLASSRLPGKVLAEIGGQPMLRHVLQRCRAAPGVAAVVACTDSPTVQAAAQGWGFEALLTAEHCSSGSERLASVVDALVAAGDAAPEHTLVINVQADQPLLDPALITALVAQAATGGGGWRPVVTPVYALGPEKIHNPHVVKVLRGRDGQALAFSRSALPHVRGLPPEQWHQHTTYWGHVGIYGYRADVLAGWTALPASVLEPLEQLEQWRLMEAGIPITTFAVEGDCLSVDTPEQLEQVRQLLAR